RARWRQRFASARVDININTAMIFQVLPKSSSRHSDPKPHAIPTQPFMTLVPGVGSSSVVTEAAVQIIVVSHAVPGLQLVGTIVRCVGHRCSGLDPIAGPPGDPFRDLVVLMVLTRSLGH